MLDLKECSWIKALLYYTNIKSVSVTNVMLQPVRCFSLRVSENMFVLIFQIIFLSFPQAKVLFSTMFFCQLPQLLFSFDLIDVSL